MPIKVFIYDDNGARRDSLKSLLELSQDMQVVGAAMDCSAVMEDMQIHAPEVVLMDINMPNVNGLEGLKKIKQSLPHIKVLMQTVFEDSDKIFDSIRNGASGYILKKDEPQRILQAIREVHEGGAVMNPSIAQKVLLHFQPAENTTSLSEREKQVLMLLADGKSYKMVADKLGITYNTVNTHIKRIYEKLHVDSLGEAIAFYYRNMA